MTYKYFSEQELSCSHCKKNGMNDAFMVKIEALREELGFPFVVTSGYRCANHPIEARKASPGAHTTGRALDLLVSGENAYRLLSGALRAGFTGIGVNQKGGSRFIHIDNIESAKERPRPWVWSY
tara:strand:- start:968 stop:1339 length:372 start_codon:yes stop_codon:yes gene_type:complete